MTVEMHRAAEDATTSYAANSIRDIIELGSWMDTESRTTNHWVLVPYIDPLRDSVLRTLYDLTGQL